MTSGMRLVPSGARRRLFQATGAAAPYAQVLFKLDVGYLDGLYAKETPDTYKLGGYDRIDLTSGLRDSGWAVRDQGFRRNTCVAFAVSACLELLNLRSGGGVEFLSPQFLYWHMRTQPRDEDEPPGWKTGATKLGYAKKVLENYGICSWNTCPYIDHVPSDLGIEGPKPSSEAIAEARDRIVNSFTYKDYPPSVGRPENGVAGNIYDELAKGHPVAAAVPMFRRSSSNRETNWHGRRAEEFGVIPDPATGTSIVESLGENDSPGHAFCIVGFEPDPKERTGGWFLFRNSWGLGWARLFQDGGKPPQVQGCGYGAISATYIEKFCWEWLSPHQG